MQKKDSLEKTFSQAFARRTAQRHCYMVSMVFDEKMIMA